MAAKESAVDATEPVPQAVLIKNDAQRMGTGVRTAKESSAAEFGTVKGGYVMMQQVKLIAESISQRAEGRPDMTILLDGGSPGGMWFAAGASRARLHMTCRQP
jgi:hypothetical protein